MLLVYEVGMKWFLRRLEMFFFVPHVVLIRRITQDGVEGRILCWAI